MNITFLVGNGFDINFGAKTSYENFYNWYLDKKTENGNVKRVKEIIKEDKEKGKRNWADLEFALGKLTAEFKDDSEAFIDCYKDISESITEYIKSEEDKIIDFKITEEDLAKSRAILAKFYSELNNSEVRDFKMLFDEDNNRSSTIRLLSFNYTTILDRYISLISKLPLLEWQYGNAKQSLRVNPSVIHINGTIDFYPILGVNDESQIENETFRNMSQLRKILIKTESEQAVGNLDYASGLNVINTSDIICVFGMSLGQTDKTWWSNIIKWINVHPQHQLILFWHTENPVSKMVYEYSSNVALAQDALLAYSPYSNEINEKLRGKIHIVFNTEKVFKPMFSNDEKEAVTV